MVESMLSSVYTYNFPGQLCHNQSAVQQCSVIHTAITHSSVQIIIHCSAPAALDCVSPLTLQHETACRSPHHLQPARARIANEPQLAVSRAAAHPGL